MRTHASVAEDVQFNGVMVLPFGEIPAMLFWPWRGEVSGRELSSGAADWKRPERP